MTLVTFRRATIAFAMTAACGSAHAFTANGNYDVTFSLAGGGSEKYCVGLSSEGASGPYRDSGSAMFYERGSEMARGTFVVVQNTIDVAVVKQDRSEYLTVAGTFKGGQTFESGVIDFQSDATIVGTATFTYRRTQTSCTEG